MSNNTLHQIARSGTGQAFEKAFFNMDEAAKKASINEETRLVGSNLNDNLAAPLSVAAYYGNTDVLQRVAQNTTILKYCDWAVQCNLANHAANSKAPNIAHIIDQVHKISHNRPSSWHRKSLLKDSNEFEEGSTPVDIAAQNKAQGGQAIEALMFHLNAKYRDKALNPPSLETAPIEHAIASDNLQAVTTLTKYGAQVVRDKLYVIKEQNIARAAVSNGHNAPAILHHLITNAPKKEESKSQIQLGLYLACRHVNVDNVISIVDSIKSRYKDKSDDKYARKIASKLFERGGALGLLEASGYDQKSEITIAKKLHEAGADFSISHDNTKKNMLHIAVEKGNEQLVQYLLNHTKANINKTDSQGNTPLQLAAIRGQVNMVDYMLTTKGNQVTKANAQKASKRAGDHNQIQIKDDIDAYTVRQHSQLTMQPAFFASASKSQYREPLLGDRNEWSEQSNTSFKV